MEAQSDSVETEHRNRDQSQRTANHKSGWIRGMTAFRSFVSFLLIAALFVFVCILLLKANLNNQIRKAVEQHLTAALQDSEISVAIDDAEFRRGKGIRITGLRLMQGSKPFLSADSIYVRTPAEIWDLISGEIDPDSIEVSGLRVFARQESDQSFNLVKVFGNLRPRGEQKTIPRISFLNSTLHCSLYGQTKPIEINLPATDVKLDENGTTVSVNAKLISSFFHSINVTAEFSTKSKQWLASGSAKRLSVTPEVFEYLPARLRQEALALRALQARLDFDFDVSGKIGSQEIPKFFVVGAVTEGSIKDDRIPFPVSGVTARFEASNSRIKIEDVIVESPIGTIDISFKTEGLSTDSPFELIAKIDPLYVDQRLSEKLPVDARVFLQKFAPQGNLSLNAKLSFQNGRWVPDVKLDLQGMSFAFHKCPYPIKNATGRITLDSEKVVIDISATASGRPVKIDGKFLDPGLKSHGRINVNLDGQIPIDSHVYAALEQLPNLSQALSHYNPRGGFGFSGNITRYKDPSGEIHEDFFYKVFVHDVELTYKHFPLPFKGVHGIIEVMPGRSIFREFYGKNVSSDTHGHGTWTAENGLDMTIESSHVELNNSFKAALPKIVQESWEGINPRGVLREIKARVRARPRQPLDFVVNVFTGNSGQLPQVNEQQQSRLSINPNWFPFELKNVDSHIEFRTDRFVNSSIKRKPPEVDFNCFR